MRASAKAHTNTNSNHSVSSNANAVIDAVQKIMGEELSQSARESWCLRLDVELGRGPLVRPRRSTQLPSRSHASTCLDRCWIDATQAPHHIKARSPSRAPGRPCRRSRSLPACHHDRVRRVKDQCMACRERRLLGTAALGYDFERVCRTGRC